MGSNRAEPTGADYCRLGERDLDKMSWLAPLVRHSTGTIRRFRSE